MPKYLCKLDKFLRAKGRVICKYWSYVSHLRKINIFFLNFYTNCYCYQPVDLNTEKAHINATFFVNGFNVFFISPGSKLL